MFIVLIVVCVVNLVLLAATCVLLNYIAKRRRTVKLSLAECNDLEGNTLAPAGYSCVTLGSQGVYVMPSNQYHIPKGTPFGTTRKHTEGAFSLDASTFLSSTVTSLDGSLDSFGVTLNGILALNAQLEAIHQQTGEQRTSTRMSTDLGAALDQVLAKHGQGQINDLKTNANTAMGPVLARSNQGTVGSQESGYGSGSNSDDLAAALDKVLMKHIDREY